IVPPGEPLTKPRACNYGLEIANGDYVVVYDAEDRPDSDQLRRAVDAFNRLPESVACLQAKLNVDNYQDSLWTRLLTLEYTLWFDAFLPGLHALGSPIPLGGTSNHFRGEVIRALRWDPWNVTEDCDLGIRLAKGGWETKILDSTTWEEAPVHAASWFRQRSRWTKGWIQTMGVHTRAPCSDIQILGIWRWIWMMTIVGGQIWGLLATPFGLVAGILWLCFHWSLYDPRQPWTLWPLALALGLLLSNGIFILAHLCAIVRRKRYRLIFWAWLLPFYWLAMGFAAWRGTLQLLYAPFLWEKTLHGVADRAPPGILPAPAPMAEGHTGYTRTFPGKLFAFPQGGRRSPASAVLLAVATALVATSAWMTLEWSGARDQVLMATIDNLDTPNLDVEMEIEENWAGKDSLEFTLKQPLSSHERQAYMATVWVKVLDNEWYQQEISGILPPGNNKIVSPLKGNWLARGGMDSSWSPQLLMRTRAVGLRLHLGNTPENKPILDSVTAVDRTAAMNQDIVDLRALAPMRRNHPGEFRFQLTQPACNPFDPDIVTVDGHFSAAGTTETIPAFLTRDFQRSKDNGVEELLPATVPEWALRWTPPEAGEYSLVIEVIEGGRQTAVSTPMNFTVADSKMPGYVGIGGSWFQYADGSLFYPLGINLRSPHDHLVDMFDIPQPSPKGGSAAMETAIDYFALNGWTMVRTWLMPAFGALEWDHEWDGFHGLGMYSMSEAWKVDRIFETARDHGMLVDLAIWQHGPFLPKGLDSQWDDNPYNAELGGPLQNPRDVLTDRATRRQMRKLLRYVAARWGADTALMAWTLWIEIDAVTSDGVVDWHREMAGYLKTIDQGRHPISTEFRSATGPAEIWSMPEIEYTQLAAYNYGELTRILRQRASALEKFAKPALLEEVGGRPDGGSIPWLAHEIHDANWIAWALPLAGSPLPWWWNLIIHLDLGRRQRRFAEFIAGEDPRGGQWHYSIEPLDENSPLEMICRMNSQGGYIWLHKPRHLKGHSRQQIAAHYAELAKGFDPLSDDPGTLFPADPARKLDLSRFGLDSKRKWQIEAWDTWTDSPPRKMQLGGTSTMIADISGLRRDTAFKISRTD
ncbi:MAG: glycosyltransferase, partial [Victivallales bacterium]|nr:glycosyltransferase [Victivallales bacterium]